MLKRGQKQCVECGGVNASRQRVCKHCGYTFYQTKRKNTPQDVDWRELESGDFIKVIQGSGPYYFNEYKEKVSISYSGVFRVCDKDDYGLICFGVGKNNTGTAYIYMGDSKKSNIFGSVYREPHKILKIKPPRVFLARNGV